MSNNQDESIHRLSNLLGIDYSLIMNICKIASLSPEDLLDFYLCTARLPTIQEIDYASKVGFSFLKCVHIVAKGVCEKNLSPPKSPMYVDIDYSDRISIYNISADEAIRLSLIIESAENAFLTGPLKRIGNQLYLYANKAFELNAEKP